MIQTRSTTDERATRLLTFGILLCPDCGVERIFVNVDRGGEHFILRQSKIHDDPSLSDRERREDRRPGSRRHITDAHCSECGYSYGRMETIEVIDGRYVVVERPVISDDVAEAAARRYREAIGMSPDGPAAARAEPIPDDAGPRSSDVEDRLRRLRPSASGA